MEPWGASMRYGLFLFAAVIVSAASTGSANAQCDTHFYVGTVHRHPTEWIIVGLFYPPYPAMRDLFD